MEGMTHVGASESHQLYLQGFTSTSSFDMMEALDMMEAASASWLTPVVFETTER